MLQSGLKPLSQAEGPSLNKFLAAIENHTILHTGIQSIIETSYNSAHSYAKHFNEFRPVFLFGREWDIQKYRDSNPDLEQFSADLVKFTKWTQSMER